jgi:putative ABC transport system substrate-binding protein
MKRREFIFALGGTATVAAWPLIALAQQSARPVLGFLNSGSPGPFGHLAAAFHRGFKEAGFVEGQNVRVEYRWAEGQFDRIPTLAADLVERKVDVIFASGGNVSAQAAKAATTSIPVIFTTADDPVATGLVTNLGRPTGNVTGVTWMGAYLQPKNVELLHEILPGVSAIGLLLNPNRPNARLQMRTYEEAAERFGKRIRAFHATNSDEIDAAFATIAAERVGALIIGTDPFFLDRRGQLVALAARHELPTVYFLRAFVSAGGLAGYGGDLADTYYQCGLYAGRILKGSKPADLPVQQATKLDLVINLKTAKSLGLTVPLPLLARADEVIE